MIIRVLYVDDEANTSKMESKFDVLMNLGIEVIPVDRVGMALQALKANHERLDAIVLDVIMPSGDEYSYEETSGGETTGFRLLKDIRSIESKLPVLLVTLKRRWAIPEDLLLRYGVSDCIEKPVSAATLASAIRNCVSQRNDARDASELLP